MVNLFHNICRLIIQNIFQPISCYERLWFSNAMRAEMQASLGTKCLGKVAKATTEKWKNLPEEERKKWEDKAKEEMKTYAEYTKSEEGAALLKEYKKKVNIADLGVGRFEVEHPNLFGVF